MTPRPAMPRSDSVADGSSSSFGPNATEVRQFLAELRGLDWDRALQVWDGRAATHTTEYARALRAAVAVGRAQRPSEWLLARVAASATARAELGDSTVTDEVLDIIADVAGAIAIRDLLPEEDAELLLLPWTGRVEPATGRAPTPAPAAVVAVSTHVPATVTEAPTGVGPATVDAPEARVGAARPERRRRTVQAWLAPVGAIALIALGSGFAALNRPTVNPAALGGTEALPSTAPTVAAAVSPAASTPAAASSPAVGTGAPTASPEPSLVAEPTARSTRTPTFAPPPNPTPKVTQTPTPTPSPMCTVISLLDKQTAQAQLAWNKAGFSGTVAFSPPVPPHYRIQWQSLAVGSSVACTRGITVRSEAP